MTEEMGPAHVDRLNTIPKLEQQGFQGGDACLAISLFEYGFAWRLLDDGEVLFIYGIRNNNSDYDRFDRCSIKPCDPKVEWNWADFPGVAECIGLDIDEWLDDSDKMPRFTDVVSDLISYYGYENVFGSSYWEGFAIAEHEEEED